jgi:hypothetical protein
MSILEATKIHSGTAIWLNSSEMMRKTIHADRNNKGAKEIPDDLPFQVRWAGLPRLHGASG